jgi:hypothetical protein
VLDVTPNEDAQRNRAGHGPRNLATLRRLALNVARAQPGKGSMRGGSNAPDGTTTPSRHGPGRAAVK